MPTMATTTTTATMTATVANLSSPVDSFTTAWREEGAQSEGAQSDPPKCSGCRTSRARRERAAEWSRRERIAT